VPAPIFQLSLLGRFGLSGPDGPIDLNSRKLAALLAFLAGSAPQAHSRDKLMTLLWGSHFNAQARQNLRQAPSRGFVVSWETMPSSATANRFRSSRA
jgi:DNA-binding SARP family transcriptional activator